MLLATAGMPSQLAVHNAKRCQENFFTRATPVIVSDYLWFCHLLPSNFHTDCWRDLQRRHIVRLKNL